MPPEEVAKLRNVAIVGQGGAGKTTRRRRAAVRRRRRQTASAGSTTAPRPSTPSRRSIAPQEHASPPRCTTSAWKKHEVNLIDTPGLLALPARHPQLSRRRDRRRPRARPDRRRGRRSRPRRSGPGATSAGCRAIGFVTRLDRERASVDHALDDLKVLGVKPAVLQVPIGARGELPRRRRRALREGVRLPGRLRDDEGGGRRRPDMADDVAAGARAAGRDDRRGERRAAREVPRGRRAVAPTSCATALREGTRAGKFLPVLCGAAGQGHRHRIRCSTRSSTCCRRPPSCRPWKGDNPKTGEQVERAADPAAPFSAFVFKTIVDPFAGKLSVLRIVSGHARPAT